jgi:large subunit ribosomal protein L6
MSRIGKNPIILPEGAEVTLEDHCITVKGSLGVLSLPMHRLVSIANEDGVLKFKPVSPGKQAQAMFGTMRALVANMVLGVTKGFERKLMLVGVGFRAQIQNRTLNLALGYSHPIVYCMPDGITAEAPTQTEIIIKGIDKQQVGQVAAKVRAYRPPDSYKGKGVRYADEKVLLKETKKK